MGRKSLGPRAAAILIENDDEWERSERRKSVFPENSNQEMEDIEKREMVNYDFSSIINLCSANKVNTKNTWSLDLIDHIDDVLELQKWSFQKASCTLQASVQIYEKRVDATLQDAFKMLENVNRTRIGTANDAEESRENRKKATGASTRLQMSNFLESNLTNITYKKVEREYEVDPLFRKMSKTFDAGGAKGLLLNHLSVHNGPVVVFDTSETMAFPEKKDADETENPAEDEENMNEILGIPIMQPTNPYPLCPSLEIMYRTMHEAEDRRDETEGSEDVDADNTVTYSPVATQDDHYDFEDECGGFYMDNDYGNDFSVCEDDESVASGPVETADSPRPGKGNGIHDSLVRGDIDFTQVDSYSYFNAKDMFSSKKADWAGPTHWKFVQKKPKDSSSKKTSDVSGKAGKRTKKVAFELDLEKVFNEVPIPIAEKKSSINLAKRSAASAAKANNLPEDLHYSVVDLCKLFLKPFIISEVLRPGQKKGTQLADGVNGIDGDDYHAAGFFDTYNDDDGGSYSGDHENNHDVGDEEGWVAPSHVVEKIEIGYAKEAKKVDVKRLKSTLWDEIEAKLDRENRERKQVEEVEEDDGTEEAERHLEAGSLSFVDSVRTVAEKVDDTKITVPFYFICLLHLANEKNLELEGMEDLSDFCIR